MSIWYELSPRPDLPYIERQRYWPHNDMKTIRFCVCSPSEDRARELASTEAKDKVWSDPRLTQCRLVSEKEFVIGST
jgi:hypothetical protein